MAESKETVLGIVEQIFQAREPASVTNRMVARVLEYLVEKIVTEGDVDDLMEVVAALRSALDNETNERSSADTALSGRVTALETLPSILSGIETAISELRSGKANTSDVAAALLQKADAADVAAALLQKADAADVTAALLQKADAADVAAALLQKADTADVDAVQSTADRALSKSTANETAINAVNATLATKADKQQVDDLGDEFDALAGDFLTTQETVTKLSGSISQISADVIFMKNFRYAPFNISRFKAVNTLPKQYNTLSEALLDVPQDLRIPGLMVLYIEYSTTTYRMFRLEATTWTTTESEWREVGMPRNISSYEMDEVLVDGVPDYLTDSNGAAILDSEGNPIEII